MHEITATLKLEDEWLKGLLRLGLSSEVSILCSGQDFTISDLLIVEIIDVVCKENALNVKLTLLTLAKFLESVDCPVGSIRILPDHALTIVPVPVPSCQGIVNQLLFRAILLRCWTAAPFLIIYSIARQNHDLLTAYHQLRSCFGRHKFRFLHL